MTTPDNITTADIKRWLSRGRGIAREIEALKEAKTVAVNRAASVSARAGNKRLGGRKSRLEDKLVTVEVYSDEIDTKITDLHATLMEIMHAIYTIDDSNQRQVLIGRYIQFKHWWEIADSMGYCVNNVRDHLHRKALNAMKVCVHLWFMM